MKHTQGEWVIKPDNSIMNSKRLGAVICQLGSADNNDAEKQANGKLIAAAPKMAESLSDTVKRLGSMLEQLNGMKENTNGQVAVVKDSLVWILQDIIKGNKEAISQATL